MAATCTNIPESQLWCSLPKGVRGWGWGYIIRDDEGDLISAGRGRFSHILDPFQAEVIACLQGLQAAIDLGISKLHLETDAFQVQQAVESKQLNLSIAGELIRETNRSILLMSSIFDVNLYEDKFLYSSGRCDFVPQCAGIDSIVITTTIAPCFHFSFWWAQSDAVQCFLESVLQPNMTPKLCCCHIAIRDNVEELKSNQLHRRTSIM